MNALANQRQDAGAATFREQLEKRLPTFLEALPPQITPERFKSVINWAVMADPGLLAADRVSLFEACLAAANDGLVPDKREGALVIYNTKVKEDGKELWIKKVQWLPMVRGVINKVYMTGLVKSVSLDLVYGGDQFRYWKDDAGEHLLHEPAENPDKSIIRRVYALVVMKDGGVFAEVMDMADVDRVKASSKTSKFGPWVDWFEEMAKKTAMKRLAKRLPLSRDITQMMERDFDMPMVGMDTDDIAPRRTALPPRPPGVALPNPDRSSQMPMDRSENHDPDTGEIIEQQKRSDGGADISMKHTNIQTNKNSAPTRNHASENTGAGMSSEDPPSSEGKAASDSHPGSDAATPLQIARRRGLDARKRGLARKAIPAEYRGNADLTNAYLDAFDGGGTDEREPSEEG